MKKIPFSILLFALSVGLACPVGLFAGQKCTMDVQCGVGKKCSNGVCTGGIVPKIKGRCVEGNFGKKVCSNTGKECSNDSQCFK